MDYKNAIFIDFEGEGVSADRQLKIPHMIGEYVPSRTGRRYRAIFFKEEWEPLANGFLTSFNSSLQSFESYIAGLVQLAQEENRSLVAWSSHEQHVLKEFCHADLYSQIEGALYNLLPPARRYCSQKKLRLAGGKRPRTLEEYYSLMAPNSPAKAELEIGAAESCRRIDKYCVAHKRWSHFSEREKRVSHNLLEYNKGDCLAAFKIAKKVSNSTSSRMITVDH
tara:strand:- start:74 stop:742 length:669 start_codon:yes stop_codon:yes gene_type:complete